MERTIIPTKRLKLILQTPEEARAAINRMGDEAKRELSPVWLGRLEAATAPDPWVHGFEIRELETHAVVGSVGFKGPPSAEGDVEIAYGVEAGQQGRGFATEAASALTTFALEQTHVRRVIAHTLPETNASTRVLSKCGFRHLGEVVDPEDGPVWRWEKTRLREESGGS